MGNVVVNHTATLVSRMLCILVPLMAEVTGVYKRQIVFLYSPPAPGLPKDNGLSPGEKAYGTSASSINSELWPSARSLRSFIGTDQTTAWLKLFFHWHHQALANFLVWVQPEQTGKSQANPLPLALTGRASKSGLFLRAVSGNLYFLRLPRSPRAITANISRCLHGACRQIGVQWFKGRYEKCGKMSKWYERVTRVVCKRITVNRHVTNNGHRLT